MSIKSAFYDVYDKLTGGAYIMWLYLTGRLK